MTREIKDESFRFHALRSLAEHLPELWPEALSVTREIKDESSRSSTLSALAKDLPPELLQEALESIRSLNENYFRSNALQGFLPHLEKLSIPFSKWKEILDDLAYQNRSWLICILPEVSPTLIRLSGDEDGIFKILKVLQEVCRQWH